jgi:hypothetical protein
VDELRVEGLDLLLEQLLLLALLVELVGTLLEGLDDVVFVLLDLSLLLLQLDQLALVDQHLVLLLQLHAQPGQLVLVLTDESLLVQVLVDRRLVLDAFGAMGELEGGEGLEEGLGRGGDHGEHGCLAVSPQTVRQQPRQH